MTVYAITDTKKGEQGFRLLIFKLPGVWSRSHNAWPYEFIISWRAWDHSEHDCKSRDMKISPGRERNWLTLHDAATLKWAWPHLCSAAYRLAGIDLKSNEGRAPVDRSRQPNTALLPANCSDRRQGARITIIIIDPPSSPNSTNGSADSLYLWGFM